jgi:SAM-dependent methyltransferase
MDESASTGERLLTGYYDRYTIEHLHRYGLACMMVANKDILDIASGEGYGSNLLASVARSVIGVDIDQAAIEHAREKYHKPNMSFLLGSADSIPVDPASIDVVVSFETLEHHDQHEKMYQEIKRILRPGGLLIISTPDKRNFSDVTGHRNAYHVKELYLEEFVALNQRYFANVQLYDQKIVFGSAIVGQSHPERFFVLRGSHAEISENPAYFDDPTYHLCLASDQAFTGFGSSFFDGGRVLADMESHLDEFGWKNEHLVASNSALQRELETLKRSFSFRLGQFLMSPLIYLRNVLRS